MKSHHKGFTLIELLVVIAIIGLLSSVVIASTNSTRKRARDSRRLADLNAVKKALTLYYNDTGTIPCATSNVYVNGTSDWLTVALVPSYLSRMPTDPVYRGQSTSGNEWAREYQYYCEITSTGRRWFLRSHLESTLLPQTHNYPNGTTCQVGGLPLADWYQDVVYAGYNPATCGLTKVVSQNDL